MNNNIKTLLLFFLSLLPPIYLLTSILRWGVNVPYWDQWVFIPFLEKSYQGTLTVSDILQPHNEHYLIFPKIFMLILARWSHWNITYELIANFCFSLGIFASLIFETRALFKSTTNISWLLPILSLFVFSLSQWENWSWGWQIQIFMNVLALLGGIGLLARPAFKWSYFGLALISGVVASFSFASGVLFWFVGLPVLFFNYRTHRHFWLSAMIWVAATIMVVIVYANRSVQLAPVSPTPTTLFDAGLNYAQYMLIYLGAPIIEYNQQAALLLGMLGLAAFVALSGWVIRIERHISARLMAFMAIGLYAIGVAALTAIARSSLGLAQALSSRYTTISSLLWISNFIFICFGLQHNRQSVLASPKVNEPLLLTTIALVIALTLLNARHGALEFEYQHHNLERARAELFALKNDELLLRLYSNAEGVREGAKILRRYGLALFNQK